MTVHIPKIEMFSQKEMLIFKPKGLWVAKYAKEASPECEAVFQKKLPSHLIFDLGDLGGFDTSGVWLLQRTIKALEQKGYRVEIKNESEAFQSLSTRIDPFKPTLDKIPEQMSFFQQRLLHLGKVSVGIVILARELIIFLGQVTIGSISVIFHPRRLRLTSIVAHIENFGVNAIPIIVLMSISLGLVLAYQGEEQLRRFGAEIYTINLVSISVVREIGILITAILVAGRTGSAITAQIGIMKINQEIDALNTLGLNPMEVLIIPRVIALVLVMPLLAFISDIAGLIGGGLMVIFSLDISPQLYITRVGESITIGGFWVGIMKAPLFGAIIGIVSCFEGMRVEGTAESVGICTTRSVVEGIFLVTIADALLSIFFTNIGI
ncbi:MAG: ABC transporter permease [Alphaproteobacteria bacterium]|nr:ABC transporter permease [Alphaproteobacteria bacterium]